MHEMGIVLNIVSAAEKHARLNHAQKVGRLTLQIGELTGIVPRFVEECWPMATEGTMLDGCKLEIEMIDGVLVCKDCGKEYLGLDNIVDEHPACPSCKSTQWTVKSGREVEIKEIAVY